MKALSIWGGFTGFLLGVVLGVTAGASWPAILWRSSVCALAGGVIFRWWGRLWVSSLSDAHRQRQELSSTQATMRTPTGAGGPVHE